MSTIANLTSSSSSALPLVNAHPHGHKKTSQLDPTADSGSSTAAQVPAATAQNLFGSLLQSLEQVIGVQFASTAPSATTTAATTAPSTTTAPGAITTAGLTPALTSAGAASYQQGNGSQTPKAAGSTVSVTA
jgi:hypothetical protein